MCVCGVVASIIGILDGLEKEKDPLLAFRSFQCFFLLLQEVLTSSRFESRSSRVVVGHRIFTGKRVVCLCFSSFPFRFLPFTLPVKMAFPRTLFVDFYCVERRKKVESSDNPEGFPSERKANGLSSSLLPSHQLPVFVCPMTKKLLLVAVCVLCR